MTERVIFEEEGVEGEDNYTPTVVYDPTVREITDTTLADAHAPKHEFRKQLEEGATDLGEGFLIQDTPALVERGPDGSIVRLTPLNELPGVHYREDDIEPVAGRPKPTPVPLPRAQREKLREILATRLFKHYASEASLRNLARYNPIRDGIPQVPIGSPETLQPLPGRKLYPATQGEVYQWLLKFVAQRAKIMDSQRYGGGTLQDLVLRIE